MNQKSKSKSKNPLEKLLQNKVYSKQEQKPSESQTFPNSLKGVDIVVRLGSIPYVWLFFFFVKTI